MDSSALALLYTALIASAATALACRWWYGRRIAKLRQRLDKAEQARQTAHERSAQAREQIAQLSQAIADLQRRHKMSLDSQRKRVDAERATAATADPPAGPTNGFDDTQPL